MKLNIVVVSALLVGAYGYIASMDHKKKDRYLKFTLDKELHITGHKQKNMDFFVRPVDFMGKVVTDVVPLSPADKVAFNNGFQKACTSKNKQKVRYTLEDMQFIAAIRYKKNIFWVKVKEAA